MNTKLGDVKTIFIEKTKMLIKRLQFCSDVHVHKAVHCTVYLQRFQQKELKNHKPSPTIS